MCSIQILDASNLCIFEATAGNRNCTWSFLFLFPRSLAVCLLSFFFTLQLRSIGYVVTFSTFHGSVSSTTGCEVDRRNVLLKTFYIVLKVDIFGICGF